MNETLIFLGKHASDICRAFRNETGMALNPRTEQPFRYGLPGSGDMWAITKVTITPEMVGMEIGVSTWGEFKTGNAEQSSKQKNFQKMIESFGGFYRVLHSPEEALLFIKDVQKCKR